MTDNASLVREKLDQAVEILKEKEVDAWMVFVRETMLTPDPSLELILGFDMVWQSAFIVTKDGRRIAIVGKHDAENVRELGGYTEIVTYVEGIKESLVKTLTDLNPAQLALNYSVSDVASDGLGHGLMLLLKEYLAETDLVDRFVSAEEVIGALRGRKSQAEVARIKKAIATTQYLYNQVGEIIEEGKNEVEIADFFHQYVTENHLGTAWDWDYCPIVDIGPDSPIGHAGPQAKFSAAPGQLIHMDFGIKENDYCADLQRVWYFRKEGEAGVPDVVQKAFEAAHKALLAGVEALKPGALGWEVDAAARQTLVDAGYPAYQHAFGHHLGRMAHDGSTVLGPRWERYGQTPYGVIEVGNVFAVELGVAVEGYGYIGLEENVVVTAEGAEWLSELQTEIWLV